MNSPVTIRALSDNLVYVYAYGRDSVLVVDPAEASVVLDFLDSRGLRLEMILLTHHHHDHTAGLAELKAKTGCLVLAADDRRITGIDRKVGDGDLLPIGTEQIEVIATPGHTKTSLSYYLPAGIVWTGDTLFVGGCGRLLECAAVVMYESLCRLADLPPHTRIYCGHDYALDNYRFALSIEPANESISRRYEQIRLAAASGEPASSTISQEKSTNPFLRADSSEIARALDMPLAAAADVFAELRRRKDVF